MTSIEAAHELRRMMSRDCTETQFDFAEAVEFAIAILEGDAELRLYNKEEIYHDCTVQVLTNTYTGQVSVGWWPGRQSPTPEA